MLTNQTVCADFIINVKTMTEPLTKMVEWATTPMMMTVTPKTMTTTPMTIARPDWTPMAKC